MIIATQSVAIKVLLLTYLLAYLLTHSLTYLLTRDNDGDEEADDRTFLGTTGKAIFPDFNSNWFNYVNDSIAKSIYDSFIKKKKKKLRRQY